jgi:predicted O-methyltransferase YrrM
MAGKYLPGHFYSPIPMQEEIRFRIQSNRLKFKSNEKDKNFICSQLPEINMNISLQYRNLQQFSKFYKDIMFSEENNSGYRYYYDQNYFCYADAIFLYCFLKQNKPKRIIEIGSGYSSAIILDCVDEFYNIRPDITFIDPDPVRLKNLLKTNDVVNIIKSKVQDLPADFFFKLQFGDLIFIDSSHNIKFGSDIQYLFFDVIPYLRKGIFLHFHDIFFPFEYPTKWLKEGRFWNEAYMLRSFLAYNNIWQIYFFNSFVGFYFTSYLSEHMPICLKNTGGSIYLQKMQYD